MKAENVMKTRTSLPFDAFIWERERESEEEKKHSIPCRVNRGFEEHEQVFVDDQFDCFVVVVVDENILLQISLFDHSIDTMKLSSGADLNRTLLINQYLHSMIVYRTTTTIGDDELSAAGV